MTEPVGPTCDIEEASYRLDLSREKIESLKSPALGSGKLQLTDIQGRFYAKFGRWPVDRGPQAPTDPRIIRGRAIREAERTLSAAREKLAELAKAAEATGHSRELDAWQGQRRRVQALQRNLDELMGGAK